MLTVRIWAKCSLSDVESYIGHPIDTADRLYYCGSMYYILHRVWTRDFDKAHKYCHGLLCAVSELFDLDIPRMGRTYVFSIVLSYGYSSKLKELCGL